MPAPAPVPPAAPSRAPSRARQPLAFLVGALGFCAYVWVVVALADHVIPLHWTVELLYYLVAGLAWTWPASRLLRWALAPIRVPG